jgi:ActR/RegA family two-component response regulator
MSASLREARAGKPALLIVDDDALIADTLAFALGADFEVHACESRAHAIALLRQLPQPPQLALVDLGLPPKPHAPDEGFQLIADLLAHSPAMRIFVLSGQSDAANARHARALGAAEFIAKPCDPAVLKTALQRALAFGAAEPASPAAQSGGLIGESAALARLRAQIAQSADAPFPALIEGESGSGKERVAQSLHGLSQRASRPYLALNCAAIAPTLVEPTLFGYVKGAFTGATANKPGYFEDAQDGTLFLDEIGELPLEMQAKLLRVLENGEYQRVGETQRRVAKARVVAATNRDLRQEVRQGASAPTCTIASRCSRWRCRRCATWGATGCCCWSTSARSTLRRPASRRSASTLPPSRRGSPIRSRATCASCATSSSASSRATPAARCPRRSSSPSSTSSRARARRRRRATWWPRRKRSSSAAAFAWTRRCRPGSGPTSRRRCGSRTAT